MAGNLKKLVNARFLKTIDPMLMRQLFERHFAGRAVPIAFDDEDADHRGLLAEYFDQPVNDWSEGLVADVHRIAELGTSHGLETILSAARRQKITLFEPADREQTADAPAEQDPKLVALHVYLYHHDLFEVAADQLALRAPTAMAEFRGPERDVLVDFTDDFGVALEAAAAAQIAAAVFLADGSTKMSAGAISSAASCSVTMKRKSAAVIIVGAANPVADKRRAEA